MIDEGRWVFSHSLKNGQWVAAGESIGSLFFCCKRAFVDVSQVDSLGTVGKALMKRYFVMAVARMGGEVIALTMVATIIIVIIGYLSKWDTSLQYSNAFFIAGCLLIIAGASSRMAAGQEWGSYQRLYAESFRDMSASERARFVVDVNSPVRLVILGIASGVLLFLCSALLLRLF